VAPQEVANMDATRTVPIAPESPIAELRSSSSGERLVGLYSHAVSACDDRDPEQVIAALEELISLLDFGYGEAAEGFYRLYSFCLREIRLGQFEQPAWILRDLRDTWAYTLSDATADTTSPEVEPAAQLG
jgi:hypothetical protein